jgi:hypothetical protein
VRDLLDAARAHQTGCPCFGVSTQLQYGKVGRRRADQHRRVTGRNRAVDPRRRDPERLRLLDRYAELALERRGYWPGRSSSGRRRDYKGKGLTGEADRFPRASRSRG